MVSHRPIYAKVHLIPIVVSSTRYKTKTIYLSTMSGFTLHPVTEDDIPELTTIGSVTFLNDRHTQFKAAHPSNPYDHAAGVPAGIRQILGVPRRTIFLKAVDNATGQILGSVVWASRGFDLNPDAAVPATSPAKPPADPKTQDKNRIGTDYVVDESPELDAVARLGERTNAHFAAFQRKMMPEGSRCMYIAGINVHPAHQRRGVGRALVDVGARRADEEGGMLFSSPFHTHSLQKMLRRRTISLTKVG